MAKTKKKITSIIHLGKHKLENFENQLGGDFQYLFSDSSNQSVELLEGKPLFKNGKLNRVYQYAIFLLDADFPWLNDSSIIGKLPAHNIFVQINTPYSPTVKKVLDLKDQVPFDFADVNHLATTLRLYWFSSSDGYRVDDKSWLFNQKIIKKMSNRGEIYREIEVENIEDWTLLANTDRSIYLPDYFANKVSFDFAIASPQIEIKLKINQYNINSGELVKSVTLNKNELNEGIELISGKDGTEYQPLLYVKGSGKFKMGMLHVRRSRGKYGAMLQNDQVVTDNILNGNVGIYFNAGDLKPPLNVYFAGYRTAEGYEGFNMMNSMGAPFLLISDWRLEGGAFYLGNHEFEDAVVDAIKATLKRLDFDPHDLILSGISMGTFGAAYYGARLNPKGVILGKPLAELGKIAQSGRVKRPNEFRTSEDIQLYFEKDLSEKSSEKLDQRFWNNFDKGNYHDTTYAVAYMLQDDYDHGAFAKIREHFLAIEPTGKILSKGFVGRHNDQTGQIVNWFLRQYRYLLNGYGRNLRAGE